MKKIVINRCYGGFSVSDAAVRHMKKNGNRLAETENFYSGDLPRDDPHLIAAVVDLGHKANGGFADLRIVEIPDGVEWEIEEYDGNEWVAEKHRTWR